MHPTEIRKEVMDGNLTITDVIDTVIEVNGLIGVGLITLGDQLKEYCWHHPPKAQEAQEESDGDV